MYQYPTVKPAFAECKNCILLCSDDGFMPATSVLLQSILENASSQNLYDIIIFHKNITSITEETTYNMFSGAKNFSIRFINIAVILGTGNFYTANRKELTSEAYYRLFSPWILDKSYEKVLYVDGDMIALKDIYPIFEIDISNYLIAAVRDYWGICNCYMSGDSLKVYRESIGLEDIDNYIISSTLLFDLANFRIKYSFDEVINLSVCKNWKQHDQDVINVLCKGSIYHLSAEWGWMSDYGNNHYLPQHLLDEIDAVNAPILVHFGGSRKPWIRNYHPYDLEFWKYADHTPYLPILLNKVTNYEYRGYIAQEISSNKIFRYYDGTRLYRLYKGVSLGNLSQCHTRYRIISIRKNTLHLEGMVGFWAESLDAAISIFFEINEDIIPASKQVRENGYNKPRNIFTYRGESFELDYQLLESVHEYKIKIICEVNGIKVAKENIGFERYCSLNRKFSNCYYYGGNWLASTNRNTIKIEKANKKLQRKYEKIFCHELWNTKDPANRKAALARTAVRFLKKFVRKPIWLISDRINRSDDNGEAFFRYLNSAQSKNVKSYFILSKKSPDYDRVSGYGTVIEPYSYKHKILHLLAKYSISSQTDAIYRNPFQNYKDSYSDLLSNIQFVFLQHGIISTDLSDWLCRRRQYLAGFVCTTPKEYNSILNGTYNYSDDVVWLTGLPRFDYREDKREKIITILPTWRMYLAVGQDPNTGIWSLRNNFSTSVYATFYRKLMHNIRLRDAAKKLGYTIQIKIHPSYSSHIEGFQFDERVKVVEENASYQDIYSKSSLIVTDYSSSVYDFLYLRKPIFYTQFDFNEFFSGKHICNKGYFDYERDGFGEVEYDLEGTVDRIIEYMENGCQLKDKYRERIDNFFAFNDQNNCQRVYEKILELDKQE